MSTSAKKTRRIETFRPGKHTSSQGVELEFTAEQLADLAQVYDPVNAPAPVVLGHPTMDGPAFGWAAGFTYDPKRERLDADLGDLEPAFTAAVERGNYRKVSLALFPPTHPANPKQGHWYPRHIGFLGAAAPAVTGLKPVQFAAGSDVGLVEVEFGCTGWAVRDAFAKLRDWLIDKFGLETADKALPSYLVESVNPPEPAPMYAAPPTPTPAPAGTTPGDVTMSTPQKTPAELQAEVDRLAKQNQDLIAAQQKQHRERATADAASFCAQLVTDRKLRPADVAALSAALVPAFMAEPVEFGDGDAKKTESPAAVLRRVLGAAATVIDTREKTPPAGNSTAQTPAFSAPAGAEVNPDQDRIYRKAKELQAANANLTFADAVSQASLALQAG